MKIISPALFKVKGDLSRGAYSKNAMSAFN